MIFNYIRVSTLDQNTERQLINVPCDRKFKDMMSGKDRERPQLQLLLSIIRSGDIINVHSMDRLARNVKDLINIVEEIINKECKIIFHKENLTFESGKNDPYQKLMMTVLGAVAELERSLILERQKEGISLAKQKGKYKGGKNKLSKEQAEELKDMYNNKKLSITSIAKHFNISRPSVYKYINNF